MTTFSIQPVAVAHTPFRQKFAIPRQAGLVNLPGSIELLAPFNDKAAVAGLESVSHIWLTFVFDRHLGKIPSLQVRPPRLGGNRKIGVFASRSSFRPNYLGQSVVCLKRIIVDNGVCLHVEGIDLLDGTPIVDIKPYLPYADAVKNANNRIAGQKPDEHVLDVIWPDQAIAEIEKARPDDYTRVQRWISQLIGLDPRPAYKAGEAQGSYAMALYDLDIHWQVRADKARIEQIIQQNGI